MSVPTYGDQLQFLNNIQRILNEGLFSATYKYALLMSLADLAIEKGSDSGDSYMLRIEDIAEKFIEYYWKQSLPYIGVRRESGAVLFQNTNPEKEALMLRVVKEMRAESNGSLLSAQRNRKLWRSNLRRVSTLIRIMPLWKLQIVGKSELPFLYERESEAVRRDHIQLLPGVVYNFRRFHAIVKALVQESWIRYIRTLDANQRILGQAVDLAEFLFGSERTDMASIRPILLPLQSGKCFYCEGSLQENKGDLDHFIPWTKYSINLRHNFVLSHSSCNNSKSDFFQA
jgi:HNH endonuclease